MTQTDTIQTILEDTNYHFSDNLCYHAKHLLEYAKRAVEITIGQDERDAIDWLEFQR